jgi:hypothetical protein
MLTTSVLHHFPCLQEAFRKSALFRLTQRRQHSKRVVNSVMAFSAADLQMVDDHIAQGEQHVIRQHELIAWLKERGHPTDIAEQLLAEFEATLHQHRAHRELMLKGRQDDPFRPRKEEQSRPVPERSPRRS